MFFKILVQCCLITSIYSISNHPILIVVSYDGFRYDFLNESTTPYMENLKRLGTYADYMFNVFPTKTFVNHHSISTGLYPEVHGVIANHIYNEDTKKLMDFDELFHYDDSIMPIWRLNEEAGKDRHSGIMMWPGAQCAYQGKNSTYVQKFDRNYDFYKRVDTVISWIKDPKKPANLVMLYFEEPDTLSHIYGPYSENVNNVIKEMDNISYYLWEQLEKNGLSDHVNVIHLSDHGVVEVTPPHMINLTLYLNATDKYKVAGSSPGLHYIPEPGYEDIVYNQLKQASLETGHFKVYKKKDIPEVWHFKNNPRTPPIFVLAEEKYGFQDMMESIDTYSGKYNIQVTSTTGFGQHGYDNYLLSMKPFFMARGPKIRRDHKVLPFDTVDLLSLFCEILDIMAPLNNGSLANVADILISVKKYTLLSTVSIIVGAILLTVVLLSIAAIVTLVFIKHQQKLTTAAALNKRFPQNFHHSSIEAQHLLEPEDA